MQMMEFLGRIVGKALYEGILLDYSFSHVFVQKLLGRYSFLDELSALDPELYRNLMYVKVNPLSQAAPAPSFNSVSYVYFLFCSFSLFNY